MQLSGVSIITRNFLNAVPTEEKVLTPSKISLPIPHPSPHQNSSQGRGHISQLVSDSGAEDAVAAE